MQKDHKEGLSDADFNLLEKNIRETGRGKWFLDEFARKQSCSEIATLSKEIKKMEQRVASMLRTQIIDTVMHEITGIKAIVNRVSKKFDDGSLGPANDYRNLIALETLKTIRKKLDNITSAYLLRYCEQYQSSTANEGSENKKVKNHEHQDEAFKQSEEENQNDFYVEDAHEAESLDNFINEQKRFLADDLIPKSVAKDDMGDYKVDYEFTKNEKQSKSNSNKNMTEEKVEAEKKINISVRPHDEEFSGKKNQSRQKNDAKYRSIFESLSQSSQQNAVIPDKAVRQNGSLEKTSKVLPNADNQEDAYNRFLATDFNGDTEKDANTLKEDALANDGVLPNREKSVEEVDFSLSSFDPRFGG